MKRKNFLRMQTIFLNRCVRCMAPGILFGSISSSHSEQDKIADAAALLGLGYGMEQARFLVQDLVKARDYYADTLGFTMIKRVRPFESDGGGCGEIL